MFVNTVVLNENILMAFPMRRSKTEIKISVVQTTKSHLKNILICSFLCNRSSIMFCLDVTIQ